MNGTKLSSLFSKARGEETPKVLIPAKLTVPGSLKDLGNTALKGHIIEYGEELMKEDFLDLSQYPGDGRFSPFNLEEGRKRWMHVSGDLSLQAFGRLAAELGIHPLIVEDMANEAQRTKFEDSESYIFITINGLEHFEGFSDNARLSMVVGENWVLSTARTEAGLYKPVRDRLAAPHAPLIRHSSDFLLHALLDTVIDRVIAQLEDIGEQIDLMELEMNEDADDETLTVIRNDRSRLLLMNKSLSPLRNILSMMNSEESELISAGVEPYLRDVNDHINQGLDMIDTYRSMLDSMNEHYMSYVSFRTNKVMQLLTIISTIFMPLSFIAGVYGMNFQHMPMLQARWGYYATWGLMITIALSMFVYFKKNKWL